MDEQKATSEVQEKPQLPSITGKKVQRINFEDQFFVIDDVTYFIEGTLCSERFAELQCLQLELGFATDIQSLFQSQRKAYDLLNSRRFADAAVKLDNNMRGITKAEQRELTVLRICALFCNTADEDRTKYNEDLVTQKADIFRRSPYAYVDFFRLASTLAAGFLETLRETIRLTSA